MHSGTGGGAAPGLAIIRRLISTGAPTVLMGDFMMAMMAAPAAQRALGTRLGQCLRRVARTVPETQRDAPINHIYGGNHLGQRPGRAQHPAHEGEATTHW